MPRRLRSSASEVPLQTQLKFKTRKNSTARISRKQASETDSPKENVSPLKRTRNARDELMSPERLPECRVEVLKLETEACSPPKMSKSGTKAIMKNCTPNKGTPRKLQFDHADQAPATPRRSLMAAIASPARSSPRLARKSQPALLSPSRECFPSAAKENISPQKCRALTFTPSKNTEPTQSSLALQSPRRQVFTSPQKGFTNILSPRRNIENIMKTPVKDKKLDVNGVLTPNKVATPNKVFVSPFKSPTHRMMSPSRNLRNLTTPTKQSLPTPTKQLPVPVVCPLLSPGGMPMSPRKQSLRSPCKAVRAFEERCYQQARKALQATQPASLIGRDKEMTEINDFIECHVSQKNAGSLYISGAPGTGKTACLTELRNGLQGRKDCIEVYINCMSFKNSQAIFNRILSEIQNKTVSLTMKAALQQLEKLLVGKGPMVVCILDEVDQLDSKHQEVLYTMFEWPSIPSSRLVLVGIANALDLTDRVLPRLQGHRCKPKLLHFAPYTKQQIIDVLEDRLSTSNVLEPSALKFCAMKVATVAGDMRKALDICRRAIELAEVELRKKKICATPEKFGAPVKKIGIAHVMKIIGEVYGNRAISTGSRGSGNMPLQQKLAVCTLLLMLKNTKAKEVTIGKLHEKYCMVCKRQQVAPSEQSEFHSLCTLVEARGIISIKKAKDARMAKVTLKMDEGELEQALQDKVLMSSVLQQGL